MSTFIKLGEKIEECKKHLFYNHNLTYDESHEYVKSTFEETGLKFGLFTYVDKEQIKQAIKYLQKNIIEA